MVAFVLLQNIPGFLFVFNLKPGSRAAPETLVRAWVREFFKLIFYFSVGTVSGQEQAREIWMPFWDLGMPPGFKHSKHFNW